MIEKFNLLYNRFGDHASGPEIVQRPKNVPKCLDCQNRLVKNGQLNDGQRGRAEVEGSAQLAALRAGQRDETDALPLLLEKGSVQKISSEVSHFTNTRERKADLSDQADLSSPVSVCPVGLSLLCEKRVASFLTEKV